MGKVVTVLTEEAPKPLGHYSQGVCGGGLITNLLLSTRKPSWSCRTF